MEGGARIPQPGELLAGKYRLTRLLGEGGMGVVLAAEHLRLRQPIAIKFLNPEMLAVDEIVQRFDREARAAATLRSRHVVRVTDVEQTAEGVPYMVMELLDGSDLEYERERRGRLPYAEAVDYVLQACGALAEAHAAGIVHRDLKPGNLFLAKEDGDRSIVKVLDFGISKFLTGEDAKLTSAGAIMGTALYMSPEQIRGDASIDARSDIWSLGVILYELIGGTAPWSGQTTRVVAAIVAESAPDLRTLCPIPEPLARTIHSMLEKDAARRPATIADVVIAIAPFAPPGSLGGEVAEQVARRSQRSFDYARTVHAAPASVPTPAAPESAPSFVSRPNPDRSTMAATTRSASATAGRSSRAFWGALVGVCMLGVIGAAMIAIVARSKTTVGGAPPNPPSSAATVAASSSAPPSVTPPAVAARAPSPSAGIAEPSATPSATAAPAAENGRAPSAGGATAKRPPPPPPRPTGSPAVTSHPAPKPTENGQPFNPPFLR